MLTNLAQTPKINSKLLQAFVWLVFLQFFFISNIAFAQKKVHTVVLDAGHGGKDPGKIGFRKYKEKEIALDIVLRVGAILEKRKDFKVVDLWERGRIANKADADLFVSVHCNAHNSQASGSETWVLGLHANQRNFEVAKAENEVILLEDNYQEKYRGFDPNSPQSVIGLNLEQEENLDKSLSLAAAVQNNFKNTFRRTDRGVKQAGFVVLHQTYMPSVLIETGFLTNKKEGAYLHSKKGKTDMASAISKAIIAHIQNIKANNVPVVDVSLQVAEKIKPPSDRIYFKVQIASGKSKISTKSYNFKGLKGVERVLVSGLYKYYIGKTDSYVKCQQQLKIARKKGYVSAFVTAFKNGIRVPVSEVIN
jgi:N-acetylmuramoyl-L-alanine amidase